MIKKKKTFGMNDIVIIFVVSQVLACVKTLPNITLNMCMSVYNYLKIQNLI